jgi:hypothetical protein
VKINAQKLLSSPIVNWPALAAKAEAKQDIEQELSALIQRATLLEAYVSRRWNTGCGDQGHEASAKHAQRVLVKVRKALGSSYPKNTPLRITEGA